MFKESREMCSSHCRALEKMGLSSSIWGADYGFIDLPTWSVVRGLVFRWEQVKRRW